MDKYTHGHMDMDMDMDMDMGVYVSKLVNFPPEGQPTPRRSDMGVYMGHGDMDMGMRDAAWALWRMGMTHE